MTVAELLAKARGMIGGVGNVEGNDAQEVLRVIVTLLSTPQPCGWPEPSGIVCDGRPGVEWASISDILPPDEARGIAIMLLRAADEAER